jgi:hypothetical protein
MQAFCICVRLALKRCFLQLAVAALVSWHERNVMYILQAMQHFDSSSTITSGSLFSDAAESGGYVMCVFVN